MNERIRELAVQAMDYALKSHQTDWVPYSHIYDAKFAELIIRECIDVALQERLEPGQIDEESNAEHRCYFLGNNGGIIDAVCAIRQHFGLTND